MREITSQEMNVDTRPIPPLKGDGYGNYRVHLVGNSGMSLFEFAVHDYIRRFSLTLDYVCSISLTPSYHDRHW